jgi:phosphatidylglycerophosphate synthase
MLWFPAPAESERAAAETLVLDAAQKGTMELMSYAETPIENWLLRRVWNMRITPLQVTFFGLVVAAVVTLAFFFGHLWLGTLLAASVGVLDGIDGKLARVKVETTALGRFEAELDYPLQMSWWIALAFYFSRTQPGTHALIWICVFLAADWIDKLFTRAVKIKTGRYLDNFAPIDRVFRFVVGSRSLYVAFLLVGLLLARPYVAFVIICLWHIAFMILHGLRAAFICWRK